MRMSRSPVMKPVMVLPASGAAPALQQSVHELEQLRGKIRHNLYKTLNIDAKVTLVSGGTLKRFEGKAKRVTDLSNL